MAVLGPKGMLFGTTAIVDSAVIAKRFVMIGSDQNHVAQATANAACLGITDDNQQNVGHGVAIAYSEMENVLLEIGAAVAQGALLASDASGRGVTATTGQNVGAIALGAGTAAGQLIPVKVVGYKSKTAP